MITDSYPGRQWRERFALWNEVFEQHYYTQMEPVKASGFVTKARLTLEKAQQLAKDCVKPFPVGTPWGNFWEYGWFFVTYTVPESQDGRELIFRPGFGKEMLIWVDGREAGSVDSHHAWVTLTRRAGKGQTIRIAAECYAGHGPRREDGGFCPKGQKPFSDENLPQQTVEPSYVAVWQEEIFQTAMDYKTLYSLLSRLPERSLREMKVTEGLERFLCRTDFERSNEQLIRELKEADMEELKPLLACRNGSTAPEFCIFGQSHLDLAWLWTLEETRRKAARTWANQLGLMDRYPEYRFFLCEPPIPEFLKESYPRLWERVKEKMRAGQIYADGAFYVECDANLPCGESLARQLIYGKEWFRDELGTDSRVAWLPDTFGFTGALPQLLLQCGVPYFATQKLIRQDPECEPFPYNNFWWEGIDGSRVLAYCFKDYNARISPASLNDRWQKDRIQEEDIDGMIFPFGYGDGGGGANRELVESALRCADLEGAPRTKWESPEAFFRRLEARGTKNVFTGELYFAWHRGTYTAQAKTKLGMRRAECLLKEAESFSCLLLFRKEAARQTYTAAKAREMSGSAGGLNVLQAGEPSAAKAEEASGSAGGSHMLRTGSFSADEARKMQEHFRKLWKRLMLMQFHDILPGTGIARVHQEAEEELQALESESRELLNQAFDGLEELLPEEEKTQRAFAFPEKEMRITSGKISTDSFYLQSPYLYAEFNRAGEVTRLTDNRGYHWEAAGLPMNRLRLYRNVNAYYDAWELGRMYEQEEETVDRSGWALNETEDERGRAALCLAGQIGDSPFCQQICFAQDGRSLEFHMSIDWRERHRMLKADFPTRIRSAEWIAETAFGVLHRPTTRSRQWEKDQYEACCHRFCLLEDGREGLAVLNDCKYGCSAKENSLSLTLLRSSIMPDMYADQGTQQFTYALLPYRGTFAEAGVPQRAIDFDRGSHLGAEVEQRRQRLAAAVPFTLEVCEAGAADSTCHVLAESIKQAEADPEMIALRLYEAAGIPQQVRLSIKGLPAVPKAWETGLPETDRKPLWADLQGIRLDFGAFEVKTVLFGMAADFREYAD